MASSLPKDATLIMRINTKQALTDYGITWKEMTKAVLKGQNDTGIDPQRTGYFFAWNSYLGAVLPLKDDDDFEKYLLENHHTTQEQRGIKWSVIDGRLLVGYTDDRAVAMGPAMGAELDNLRNTVAQLLNQSDKESGSQSPLFARLQERTEPIALATDLQNLTAIPVVGEKIQKYLKQSIDVSAGLSVGKENTTLSMALSSDDAKTNQLFDALDETLQPLNGNLLKTAPKRQSFHLEMGLRGERLIELLRSIPEVRAKLLIANTIFDADLMLKNIDGDVAFSLPRITLISKPSPIVQMEMKDASFIAHADEWNDELSQAAGVRFLPVNARQGRVETHIWSPIFYSVDENRLTLSDSQSMAWTTTYVDLGNEELERMKGYRLYANLNLGNILLFKGFVDRSQQVVLRASDARQWQLELPTSAINDIIKLLLK